MTNEEIRTRCQSLSTTELDNLIDAGAIGPRTQRIAEEVRAQRGLLDGRKVKIYRDGYWQWLGSALQPKATIPGLSRKITFYPNRKFDMSPLSR